MGTFYEKCHYCKKETGGQYHYIYPAPSLGDNEGGYHYPWHGAIACLNCAPGIIRLQKAQGLLVNGYEGEVNNGKSKQLIAGLEDSIPAS